MRFMLPDRFVIGTVGLPGDRTFYLQIVSGSSVFSLKLEKQQAAIMALELENLMAELNLPNDPGSDAQVKDLAPLEMPVDTNVYLTGIGLFYEKDIFRFEIAYLPLDDSNSDSIEKRIEVHVDVLKAREFASRTKLVVASGRTRCPFCNEPMDASGHICARANGYRR